MKVTVKEEGKGEGEKEGEGGEGVGSGRSQAAFPTTTAEATVMEIVPTQQGKAQHVCSVDFPIHPAEAGTHPAPLAWHLGLPPLSSSCLPSTCSPQRKHLYACNHLNNHALQPYHAFDCAHESLRNEQGGRQQQHFLAVINLHATKPAPSLAV